MPLFADFCGGAYRARSETIDAEVCLNLYRETTTSQGNAKHHTLIGTPGLSLVTSVSDNGYRGSLAQDGRQWMVIGATLYEINVGHNTATSLGTIVNDGKPASFAINGRGGEQLAIVGGGQLKILNLRTNVLSASIALPLTNTPVQIAFIDGYFLLVEANTIRVWFSALEDGTSWDALDFFARSHTSDNMVGIVVIRDRIWTFGSLSMEIYYDSGDADNPFTPYPGSIIQQGAASPYAIGVQGETVVWLSQNSQGQGTIMRAQYAPEELSTPAISYALEQEPTLSNAEVFIYEQEGHSFSCWTFPTSGNTWCHDASENVWHARATWNTTTGVNERWRVRGGCSTSAGILVGDYDNGSIYLLDLDTFTDNGTPILRQRRAPYLSGENQWMFIDQIEIGIQWGAGLISGQGSAPKLMLRVSRDNAHTWGSAVTATMGAIGRYLAQAVWQRLGRVRSDRLVIEVTQSDPVRAVWGPGLWIRATPGTGQI